EAVFQPRDSARSGPPRQRLRAPAGWRAWDFRGRQLPAGASAARGGLQAAPAWVQVLQAALLVATRPQILVSQLGAVQRSRTMTLTAPFLSISKRPNNLAA